MPRREIALPATAPIDDEPPRDDEDGDDEDEEEEAADAPPAWKDGDPIPAGYRVGVNPFTKQKLLMKK